MNRAIVKEYICYQSNNIMNLFPKMEIILSGSCILDSRKECRCSI